jgi:hypothetical protein
MHWRPRTLIWSGRGKSGDGDRRRYQQWCEVGQFDTHGGTLTGGRVRTLVAEANPPAPTWLSKAEMPRRPTDRTEQEEVRR